MFLTAKLAALDGVSQASVLCLIRWFSDFSETFSCARYCAGGTKANGLQALVLRTHSPWVGAATGASCLRKTEKGEPRSCGSPKKVPLSAFSSLLPRGQSTSLPWSCDLGSCHQPSAGCASPGELTPAPGGSSELKADWVPGRD